MLYHLTPSDEMTGGPWYTEAELDTEFIKLLCSACLHYIKDRVGLSIYSSNNSDIPLQSFSKPKSSESSRALYSISSSPSYPNARNIQSFLSKSKITETELTVEHVEMLLNVLVLDGEIEKVRLAFSKMMLKRCDDDGFIYRSQPLEGPCGTLLP
jgi:DNA-directed RNA polymerase III subunit RPC6